MKNPNPKKTGGIRNSGINLNIAQFFYQLLPIHLRIKWKTFHYQRITTGWPSKMKRRAILYYFYFITLLSCQMFATEQDNKATVYVVATGISDYSCINSLRLPRQDAIAIARLFKSRNAEVTLLTDRNATKDILMKALQTVFLKAKKDDMILFFFSGHGFPNGFCTYDTNCKSGKYITYDELKQLYSHSKAERKLIFADACFSGAIRTESKQKASKESFTGQHLLLFLSSRTDETSLERTSMQNGYFTTYLLDGLKGKADKTKDQIVTARELFDYVSPGVSMISGNRQHPVMWGKFSDNLILMDNRIKTNKQTWK